jgi:hypothetical protein
LYAEAPLFQQAPDSFRFFTPYKASLPAQSGYFAQVAALVPVQDRWIVK